LEFQAWAISEIDKIINERRNLLRLFDDPESEKSNIVQSAHVKNRSFLFLSRNDRLDKKVDIIASIM